jgi:hypothetical protein
MAPKEGTMTINFGTHYIQVYEDHLEYLGFEI